MVCVAANAAVVVVCVTVAVDYEAVVCVTVAMDYVAVVLQQPMQQW